MRNILRAAPGAGAFLRAPQPSLSLFAVFSTLYIVTLAPGLLPADSGEFQAVAALLGVAHPPGFPLYTLLGKAFISILPLGSPAYRLNLLSVLFAALTLVFVSRTVRTLSGSQSAGLVAAGALGVSTTFWSQATTANVRMPTALCAAMAMFWLARLGEDRARTALLPWVTASESPTPLGGAATRTVSPGPDARTGNPQPMTVFALCLGLGISHHASLAFMGVVFIIVLALLDPTLVRPSRRWLGPALAFCAPFVFTLYLPIRGAAGAYLAPPHLASATGFLEHVLARGFEGDFFYFARFADLPDRLAILGNILTFQFNLWILAGALIGALTALRRDRRLFLLLAGSFAVHSFVAITYRAPQTVEYMLPAYVVLAVALGYGAGRLSLRSIATSTGHASRFDFPSKMPLCGDGKSLRSIITFHVSRIASYASRLTLRSIVTLPSFFLAACLLFLRNLPSYVSLSRDHSTQRYAETVLMSAPASALILSSWHWATPMWYLQRVEGMRPDVEVQYVFPQGESLAQNWVERITANIGARPVVVTSFYPLEYGGTQYRFLPLGPAWLVSASPMNALPYRLDKIEAVFGGQWQLAGYSLEADQVEPGETIPVVVAWRSLAEPQDINFFVQLLGPDGALYGQMDVGHPAARFVTGEWLVDRYLVTVRLDAPPGKYALVTGAYWPDGRRLTADGGEQDSWRLATIRVNVAMRRPVTLHPIFRPLPGPALIGYDYDRTLPDSIRLYLHWRLGNTAERATVWAGGSPFAEQALPAGRGYLTTAVDLPPYATNVQVLTGPPRAPSPLDLRTYSLPDPTAADRYVPLGGATVLVGARHTSMSASEVQVYLDFLAARPLAEDNIVKVDLIGPGYAWRAESNSVPAGGAIPTLKWVAGSLVHDRHRLVIPANAATRLTAAARLELAAYDHFTGRVLPILDPRLAVMGATLLLLSSEK